MFAEENSGLLPFPISEGVGESIFESKNQITLYHGYGITL